MDLRDKGREIHGRSFLTSVGRCNWGVCLAADEIKKNLLTLSVKDIVNCQN